MPQSTKSSALDEYAAKRAFQATPEPQPRIVQRKGPLLFVVQQHAARQLHYDLRLELDGVLKSWAVPKGPSLQRGEKRLAVPTEDHPFDYASFEGVIPPKQYGAGQVIVWDCGVYSPDEGGRYSFHDRTEAEQRVREELARGKLSFTLRGEKLKGSFALVRTTKDQSWLLLKHQDRFVRDAPDVLESDCSVLSGMAVADLQRLSPITRLAAEKLIPHGEVEELPRDLLPMLAAAGETTFTHPDWLFEPKLDGYRTLAIIERGKVTLRSRRGQDYSAAFPQITSELIAQNAQMIVDGELLVFDSDGKPSFNALQNRAKLKSTQEIARAEQISPSVLICFDLLHFEGFNLRSLPYQDRSRYLRQCLLPSPRIQIVHADSDGPALYQASLDAGFEGVIGKRKTSRYEPGRRSNEWLKFKAMQTVDLVIGGYTTGKGSRAKHFGALLLGYPVGRGKLKFVGHCGSGFDDLSLDSLRARLDSYKSPTSPFTEKPELNAPATWLQPKLVAEVQFSSWTEDERLRWPVFLRLREDLTASKLKSPAQQSQLKPTDTESAIDRILQQLEQEHDHFSLLAGGEKIALTSLDKVLWPADPSLHLKAVTKRDYLRYLAKVSPYLLPHLKDRPLTMIRMPEGINGERFYQKHWEWKLEPFVDTVELFSDSKNENHRYLLCNNLPTLLWLGQNGTLEFHVWHSRVSGWPEVPDANTHFVDSTDNLTGSILNYPDYVVFDIDPYIYSGKEAKGAEPEFNIPAFDKGKQVAFWLKELLDAMGLRALVKTSGKTGLHIFVPIVRTLSFDEARKVCEMIGRHLLRQHPREITMEWAVIKRTGKIFIDHNMNVRTKTLNAAYSPRGVLGAPVSMPLSWEELKTAHPLDFRMDNIFTRLAEQGDQWQRCLQEKQDLQQIVFGPAAQLF